MKRNHILLAISGGIGALALGLLVSEPAHAATDTGTMQVTANVQGTCAISTPTLDFGTLVLSGGLTTASSTSQLTTVTCTTGVTPTALAIGDGLYDNSATTPPAGYNFALNSATTPGSYLPYALSTAASFTSTTAAIPPDVATGPLHNTPTLTPSGASYTATIYGYLPASQTVIAGAYSDTVTLTVTY